MRLQNSPDDLQLLSDAPAHHIFALLGPMYEYFFNDYESSTNNGKDEDGLPDVYCVIQV